MKLKSILAGAFSLMLMASCSDANEPVPDNPGTATKGDNYIVVKIASNLDSRAADTDASHFEDGEGDESVINALRFYFFKEDGNPSLVGTNGTNYVEVGSAAISDGTNGESPNVEAVKTVKVSLAAKDGNKELADQIASMIVIANPDNYSELGTGSLAASELKVIAADFSIKAGEGSGKFLMTNSVYSDGSKAVCEVAITENNICDENKDNTGKEAVKVYIERVVAKVRATYDWNTAHTVKDGVTIAGEAGGATYTAVLLKENRPDAGNNYPNIQVNGKNVYVIFKGWDVINTANKSNLLKKITAPTWNLEWAWNWAENHRSYWAINPSGVSYTTSKPWNTLTNTFGKGETRGSVVYVQENAADDATGKKTSANTAAVFAAVLVTIDDSNVATPITIAKLGQTYVTGEDMIKTVYNSLTTKVWVESTNQEDTGNGTRYTTDILKYLDFVKITAEGDNQGKVFVQLKAPEGETLPTFYKNITSTTTDETREVYSKDDINAALMACGEVSVYYQGKTYYTYPIEHLGVMRGENNADNYGKYGIVRNHIYDIKLKAVYGPGNVVFDPQEEVVEYVDHSFYLNAVINVLAWRVVPNDAILDWPDNTPEPDTED